MTVCDWHCRRDAAHRRRDAAAFEILPIWLAWLSVFDPAIYYAFPIVAG